MAANSIYGLAGVTKIQLIEASMVVLWKHEDDSFKNESARDVTIDPLW